MIVFTLLAAALVGLALVFVIPPLLGRGALARAGRARQRQAETALTVLREQIAEIEQEFAAGRLAESEYLRTRAEIEARALEEGQSVDSGMDLRPARVWAMSMLLLVPVLGGLGYLVLGEPAALDPQQQVAKEEPHIDAAQMSELMQRLIDRLEREPDDPTAWVMLGRSFIMLDDMAGAAAAWERIGHLAPEDADVLADWADLLAASSGAFDGVPEALLARALALQPEHPKALALSGTAAYSRGEYAEAAARWERILAQAEADDPARGQILAGINDARQRGGLPLLGEAGSSSAASAVAAPASDQVSAAPGLAFSGRVSLADELQGVEIPADAAVFVFLRPLEGGMPLAALRFSAGELPRDFDFAEAPRMSEAPLPDTLVVGARISRSGEATARAGDLEGSLTLSASAASGLVLRIDRVRD